MNTFPALAACGFFFLTCPLLPAETVTLAVSPGSGSHNTFTLNTGETGSNDVIITGTLELDLSLNPATGAPLSAAFVGGQLNYSDTSTTLQPVDPNPNSFTKFVLENTGISGPLSTPGGPSTVASGTGLLTNSEHLQVLNNGTATFRIRQVFFGNESTLYEQTEYYTNSPASNLINGENTITAVVDNPSPLVDRRQITFLHIPPSSTATNLGNGIILTIVENGSITASGEMTSPSAAYKAWHATAGLAEPIDFLGTHPQTGQPLAILYALGLEAGFHALPLTISPTGNTCRINLPAGGTLDDVHLEYSDDLGTTPWKNLGPTGLFEPLPAIPAGTSGLVEIPLPPSGTGFVRLAWSWDAD